VTEQERGGSERPDSSEPHDQEETGGQSRDPLLPSDEDAAWAAIVAGYGEEPPDPPGAKPFKSVEDLALLEPETNDAPEPSGTDRSAAKKDGPDEDQGKQRPLGSSVSFAPGIAATPGPRDHTAPEPSDDDFDAADEGHFVPPEPPPLPEGDVTARFAWLAVVGGPILLLLAVLLGWDMTCGWRRCASAASSAASARSSPGCPRATTRTATIRGAARWSDATRRAP